MRVLMAVLAGAGLLAAASRAGAAEAYVCDGGRVLYVEARDLERLKRTDRCIAGHYGLAVPPAAAPAAAPVDAEATLPVVPINARETARPTRRLAGAAAAVATGTVGRIVEPPAPKALPVAHPDTDFRSVRILNAAPGSAAIFHHQR